MPVRSLPIITKEIYHVFNRATGSDIIFNNKYDYKHFLQLIEYYQYDNTPYRFSFLKRLKKEEKKALINRLIKEKKLRVSIIAYCLMPNHFHLLLKQKKENGIIKFMQQLQNSHASFFNKKNQRKGSLFGNRFKTVRVESNPQLLHVSRYIHLNPYSSYIVRDYKTLLSYPYSSLPEYLDQRPSSLCEKNIVLKQFSKTNNYKKFILNNADYQRSLEKIKHKLLE